MSNITTYIDKITVPSGSDTITANLVDSVSGYAKDSDIYKVFSFSSADAAQSQTGGLTAY